LGKFASARPAGTSTSSKRMAVTSTRHKTELASHGDTGGGGGGAGEAVAIRMRRGLLRRAAIGAEGSPVTMSVTSSSVSRISADRFRRPIRGTVCSDSSSERLPLAVAVSWLRIERGVRVVQRFANALTEAGHAQQVVQLAVGGVLAFDAHQPPEGAVGHRQIETGRHQRHAHREQRHHLLKIAALGFHQRQQARYVSRLPVVELDTIHSAFSFAVKAECNKVLSLIEGLPYRGPVVDVRRAEY
jgi:hypothetical protein